MTDQPRDPSRRQFFRAFGQQTIRGAGNVIGAADQLRRGSTEAANELLGLGLGDPRANAARLAAANGAAGAVVEPRSRTATAEFRSPYLLRDDALEVLDQRALPQTSTVRCASASEIAAAIVAGACGSGPVLGQIAAYGLVQAVVAARARPGPARHAAFMSAANTLRMARPTARALSHAVERLTSAWEALPADADRGDQVAGLRDAADLITAEQIQHNAQLGRLGAAALDVGPRDRPISMLLHADMGPLSSGMIGGGMAVVQALVAAGRDVHVWQTESRPSLEGRRQAAHQLAQADIAHTVIPDTAVGWLLASKPVDAVLLRADWVCASGDTVALLGALGVARLAQPAGVPVYACATRAVIDPATAAADDIRRPPAVPDFDILPAAVITALLTEDGPRRLPLDPVSS